MVRALHVLLAVGLAAGAALPARGEVVQHSDYAVSVQGDLTVLLWLSGEVLNAPEAPEGFPAAWWPSVENTRHALARWLRETGADAFG
jgi:hypothetical protein